MPTLTKLYTMQEAAQHNTPQDCWVVIDGKVGSSLGVPPPPPLLVFLSSNEQSCLSK